MFDDIFYIMEYYEYLRTYTSCDVIVILLRPQCGCNRHG